MRKKIKQLIDYTAILQLQDDNKIRNDLNVILPALREIIRETLKMLDEALPKEVEPD